MAVKQRQNDREESGEKKPSKTREKKRNSSQKARKKNQ